MIAPAVAKALKWSVLGRFVSQIVTWTTTLFVIRILTPDDYGLLAAASTLILLFTLLSEMGLGPAIVRAENLTNNKIQNIHGIVLTTCLFIAFSLGCLSPLVSLYFGREELTYLVLALALVFIFESFVVVPRSLLLRRMDYKQLSIIETVARIVAGLTTLVFALLDFGVWALAFGNFAAVLCHAIGFSIAAKYWLLPRFKFGSVIPELTFGGFILAQRVVWWFFSQVDIFIIGRLFSTATLGAYSVSLQLATMPQQKLSRIINQVAFSSFSNIKNNPLQIQRHLLKSLSFLSIVSFPLFFGISAISHEIITVIIGNNWVNIIIPLTLLPIMIPLRMAVSVIGETLNAVDKANVTLGNSAISLGLIIPSILIGSNWGLFGICMAWVVTTPVFTFITLMRAKPHIGVGSFSFIQVIWKPALASAVMYIAVSNFREIALSTVDNIDLLLSEMIVGMAVYMIAILVLAKQECLDFYAFAKSK